MTSAPIAMPPGMDSAYVTAFGPSAMAVAFVRTTKNGQSATLTVGSASIAGDFADFGDSKFFVALLLPDVGDFLGQAAVLSGAAAGPNSDHFVSPVEVVVDLPIGVGCFEDVGAAHFVTGSALTNDGMTPAACLTHCFSQTGSPRYAFIRNGDECQCDGQVDGSLEAHPEGECGAPCDGDANQICGGDGDDKYSVFVASCPAGQVRFGHNCYADANPAGDLSIAKNEENCREMVSVQHIDMFLFDFVSKLCQRPCPAEGC